MAEIRNDLDKEFMERNGFEKSPHHGGDEWWYVNYLLCRLNAPFKQGVAYSETTNEIYICPKSIRDLQNLYCVVTRDELEVKV